MQARTETAEKVSNWHLLDLERRRRFRQKGQQRQQAASRQLYVLSSKRTHSSTSGIATEYSKERTASNAPGISFKELRAHQLKNLVAILEARLKQLLEHEGRAVPPEPTPCHTCEHEQFA